MNVKKYRGNDLQEAIIKIKNDLGKDAIIISKRKVRKPGILGFFRKKSIEVVAAIESEAPPQKVKPKKAQKTYQTIKPVRTQKKLIIDEEKKKIHSNNNNHKQLESEINTLKVTMNEILSKLDSKDIKKSEKIINDASTDNNESLFKKDVFELLSSKGVTNDNINYIYDHLRRKFNIENINKSTLKQGLKNTIKELLGDVQTIDEINTDKKSIMFLGPTGVGKTTTLAKLAAKLTLVDHKKVGLITADTYRIAAVDQLKTYSEILDIPLRVIYEHNEILPVLDEFSDMDYILIDTAGRSHRDKELYEDINGLLSYLPNPQIFLVISLITNYIEIENIINSYDFLNNYNLLFTKQDEVSQLGNVLNTKLYSKKKLSYITNGQSVPDDIDILSVDYISSELVRE